MMADKKTYKVKFNMHGGSKRIPELKKGDRVIIVNAKNLRVKVDDVWEKDKERYYRLGAFGLVRSNELEWVQ